MNNLLTLLPMRKKQEHLKLKRQESYDDLLYLSWMRKWTMSLRLAVEKINDMQMNWSNEIIGKSRNHESGS